MSDLVQHLRRAVLEHDETGLSDGQLLKCFLDHRDEAAVAALVRRHGPMVWGVCRRILPNHHDAEDAFQAAFLVFMRKAASVKKRHRVGSWLYGVAYQTARKARATLARRRTREKQVAEMPDVQAPEEAGADLRRLLDQELSRLPDRYRAALVLCELQGRTRREAAAELGLPEGTLAGRLTRGRALLARRLARHGLVLSGAPLAALFSENATAAVPAGLLSTTIRIAAQTGAAERIPATVAALTEGVLKAMLMTKLRTLTAAVLVAGMVALATGMLAAARSGGPGDGEEKTPASGDAKAKPEGKADRAEKKGEKVAKLWAALSVNHPLFREGVDTDLLQLEFALVNDSDEVINPKLPGEPRLVINGKERKPSGMISGPRDRRFQALPPGDNLQFGLAPGKDFAKPGIYRVYWQGDGYRSNEVLIRVLPKEPPPQQEAQKLEGTWIISNEESFSKGERWVIKNGVIWQGKKHAVYNFYEVHADKTPKEIDIKVLAQPDGQPVRIIEGIYSLQGDELKLYLPTAGGKRPAAFPDKPTPEVIVLKRQKP